MKFTLAKPPGRNCARAWLDVKGRAEGAADIGGRVLGCYLHGLFASDSFRTRYLEDLGAPSSNLAFNEGVDATLDALAGHMETHVDLDLLMELAARPASYSTP